MFGLWALRKALWDIVLAEMGRVGQCWRRFAPMGFFQSFLSTTAPTFGARATDLFAPHGRR